jgi:hypothetical protein
MKNLADSLRLYANVSSVCGVLIAHDDLFLNISYLTGNGFPSDHSVFAQFPGKVTSKPSFTLYPNKTIKVRKQGAFFPIENYNTTTIIFKSWLAWWSVIIPKAARAVTSAHNRELYLNSDGGLDFFGHHQADFLYLPTTLTEPFAADAEWMVENEIMLEVAVPMILSRLQKKFNANVKAAPVCTEWDYGKRWRPKVWVPKCFKAKPYGTVHPVKLSEKISLWDSYFDSIVIGK